MIAIRASVATGTWARASLQAVLLVALLVGMPAASATIAAAAAEGEPFSRAMLIEKARKLAASPMVAPGNPLPESLANLTYDQYRDIRHRPDATIWLNDRMKFSIDLLPAGFIYAEPVDIWLVDEGRAHPLLFDPDRYEPGPLAADLVPDGPIPLSGFRLRFPLNSPDVQDEVAVFQGASYFRAVGRGEVFGLSARGLAIDTGRPEGEEFPAFRSFWIERPAENAQTVVVHALLDSPATTGVYRFTVRPGDATITDVELVLFPRRDISHIGLAPFSSMFLFDDINRDLFTDYRSAVHDSDGLSIWSGNGQWLWRPLDNPDQLRISAFQETGPRGFGLVQRKRAFADYQDAEARYGLRPSAWVEPVGDWGRGAVTLLEIPTRRETNDNIAVFWQPRAEVGAGEEFGLTYRLHWDALPPAQAPLARVHRTRLGLDINRPDLGPGSANRPLFVIDYLFDDEVPGDIELRAESSTGRIRNLNSYRLPVARMLRVAFELDPEGATEAELRLDIGAPDMAGETWLYRWNE